MALHWRRAAAWTGLLLLWAAAAFALRDSYLSIIDLWVNNSTFSHGWLIVPIATWLAWRARAAIASVPLRPSWVGLAAMLACLTLWLVGAGSGVAGIEQFAVVALVIASFTTALGLSAARAWLVPLGFLLFGVPVGHALVPALMQMTADFASFALRLTGVPVVRSFMLISIPGGDFEVARACSGLNYLVTGLVLGTLYSYLNYRGWRKRALGVLAFLVIPVLANGLRVYFTILMSHLTDMRFGPGAEHVWFGRVFFILVMLMMFWIGRRWHDDPRPTARPSGVVAGSFAPTAALPVLVGLGLVVATPAYLNATVARAEARLAQETSHLALPVARADWSGPHALREAWKPFFRGGRIERLGSYLDSSGGRVDAYVGVYGIGGRGSAEMISFGNRIAAAEHTSLVQRQRRSVDLPARDAFTVVQQDVSGPFGPHRVWYWYSVGERVVHDRYRVKALEAVAFLARGAVSERIVTLATADDAGADARLESFLAAHAGCVTRGFVAEACSP
jgi:exosortase A